MMKPKTRLWLPVVAILIALSVTGCEKQTEPSGTTRRFVQGMQVTFYEIEQGKERWFEVDIAVDGSRSFRMPVFFTENERLQAVTAETAKQRVDAWLKQRAVTVAALSSIGLHEGQKSRYITISENPEER
ncbi:hypothetical protein HBO07_25630 [Pseudomonas proteolytica]|uniref:hypothetical protein n=1 Tax=Pseudomonas proteolytica TaxID=219574 RepID=UPI0014758476|nr:hypothetical protein [Pseudomonas proteolytica]NMZ14657.1 hypothetical protein [Pseudomonas proteolytica]